MDRPFTNPEVREGVFSDLVPTGSGFVSFADGRKAFVLPSLIRRMALRLGDVLECRMVPNFPDKTTEQVPWRVVFVSVVSRAPLGGGNQGSMDEVAARILDFLEGFGGAWTLKEIALELGSLEERFVLRALEILRDRGQACFATLYASGVQETYWSSDYDCLLPVGALEEEEENLT
jgi:hypothetical protein